MNSNRFSKVILVIGLAMMAVPAMAQTGGCTVSPENPTIVLGLLGAAAAGLPWIRAKIASTRRSHRERSVDEARP